VLVREQQGAGAAGVEPVTPSSSRADRLLGLAMMFITVS